MVNYTPNLNLAKPTLSDVADITEISNNFDILDSALAKMVTTDSPQEITGSKTFSGTVIVNGHNLRNAVTTDETQTISGQKTFSNSMYMADRVIQFNTGRTGNCIHIQDRNITARATPPSSTTYTYPLVYKGQDGSVIGDMVMGFNSGGQSYTQLENYDKDGAVKSIILNLTGNPTSNTVVTRADVFGTNQVNNNLVHTISDENIDGIKRFNGIVIDRTSYGKNTSGSNGYMATFKLPTTNRNERYMIASFVFAGRSSACGMFTVVWDEASSYLSVREFYGNNPPPMCIASDPNGAYWLCFRMNTNNALQFFNFLLLRSAGFQSGKLEPVYDTGMVNVQTTEGWTIIRESV